MHCEVMLGWNNITSKERFFNSRNRSFSNGFKNDIFSLNVLNATNGSTIKRKENVAYELVSSKVKTNSIWKL